MHEPLACAWQDSTQGPLRDSEVQSQAAWAMLAIVKAQGLVSTWGGHDMLPLLSHQACPLPQLLPSPCSPRLTLNVLITQLLAWLSDSAYSGRCSMTCIESLMWGSQNMSRQRDCWTMHIRCGYLTHQAAAGGHAQQLACLAQNEDVRWAATEALAHLCHLSGKAVAKLHQAVLGSRGAAAACFWRWQQELERLKLPGAMPWLGLQGSLAARPHGSLGSDAHLPAHCECPPWLHCQMQESSESALLR